MRRLLRDERGFVVIELPVVITIIGILIALLVPVVPVAREAADRVGPCDDPPQQGAEPVELTGELKTVAVANVEQATFRYEISAGDARAEGTETGNEWRLVGSADGAAALDTPMQLVDGLRLLGISQAVRGAELDITLRAFFAFDKDLRLLNMEILEAVAKDPCL